MSKDRQVPDKDLIEPNNNKGDNYLAISRKYALTLLKERKEEWAIYTQKEAEHCFSLYGGNEY